MYSADFGFDNNSNVEIKDGVCKDLNAYARIKNFSGGVIEIENATVSEFANFTAGQDVLIHVSATNGTDAELLGKYDFYKIELVSGNILTLDKNLFDVDLNYYYVQMITVPQFKNLKLINSAITPAPFDVFKFIGGISVFKVFDTLELQNSFIDLTDCGIPITKKNTYRPLTLQEYEGETDGSRRAGEENFITADRFILNSGDGAAMIFAKNFIADDNSRIGNPKIHGRANCRGAADSPFKPSNVTNIGGSSILLVADSLQIQPQNLAKYKTVNETAGKGLARCYIASNTILPNDEKLYAFDILADDGRVKNLGVENFGGGITTLTNPQFRLNNTAEIDSVVGNKIFFKNKTLSGYTPFAKGYLVLIRNAAGEFKISEILYCDTDKIIVKDLPDNPVEVFSVSVFGNLTLENYTCDKILAVAVADTLTINGEISVNNAINLTCGNSQSFNKVGSCFLLAKKIIFGENAKLPPSMIIAEEIENFSKDIFTGEPNFIYTAS